MELGDLTATQAQATFEKDELLEAVYTCRRMGDSLVWLHQSVCGDHLTRAEIRSKLLDYTSQIAAAVANIPEAN